MLIVEREPKEDKRPYIIQSKYPAKLYDGIPAENPPTNLSTISSMRLHWNMIFFVSAFDGKSYHWWEFAKPEDAEKRFNEILEQFSKEE